MEQNQLFTIREALPEDIPFIYSSWLKSYKHDSFIGKSTRSIIFFPHYREIIDLLLSKAKVLIACKEDEPNVVYGYIVYDDQFEILHYVYVKDSFRRFGIMKSLLYSASISIDIGIIYTHETFLFKKLIETYNKSIYNPFLLYRRS